MKEVRFVGRALDELREFPDHARHDSGVELYRVQQGMDPTDWKPMSTVGPGVREIRVKTAEGIFRTMYTTVIGECVYVLHCFTKKTQKTPKSAKDLCKKRLEAARRDAAHREGDTP
ncbi:MAG TPA: type II toxin-antitoxin system RelE/ParE family toxin [Mycobacterium sp.]|nr:type II toxin-antitoxin system RelE/ParE family toxin [Mycobacterium sp.]